MLGDIITGILIILLGGWLLGCIFVAYYFDNYDHCKLKMCILIIILILFGGAMYLNADTTIKELTVYQNENIEVKTKNGFGDIKTERYSFSEYKVKKSNKNSCFMYDKAKIELTPKYYEQYRKSIEKEKTIHIKID